MYASFQIELQDDISFPDQNLFLPSPVPQNSQVLKYVKSQLENYLVKGKSLDATKIKADWFPDLPECHVFISHSHKDIKLAKKFADWLYNKFGIISFIDSEVWGYSEELLRKLDDEYSINQPDNGYYSYKKRNVSTAHVHTLLTTALLQMMDNTECLIFLNTPNSTTTKDILTASTLSPWIYTEILASKILRPHRSRKPAVLDHALEEDRSLQIEYTFATDHLIAISYKDDLLNLPNIKKPYEVLDNLYEKFGERHVNK